MLRRGVVGAGLVLALAGAAPVGAQIAWDAPMLIGPGAPGGLGIYLMSVTPGDLGVMGTYRTSPVPVGLGFRGGIGEGAGGDLAVFGGVDVAGNLMRATDEVPLDIVWFAGAGLGIGEDALLSFPLGLSIGAILETPEVTFSPYAAPRVVLDACFGDNEPGHFCAGADDLDLDLAVDLGLDLSFSPSWTIRFAATLGDRRKDALAIGIAFPY